LLVGEDASWKKGVDSETEKRKDEIKNLERDWTL